MRMQNRSELARGLGSGVLTPRGIRGDWAGVELFHILILVLAT